MSWNFRIIRKTTRVGRNIFHTYDLHEVYYNKRGRPTHWTLTPVTPNGYESIREMQQTLCRMLADTLELPALEIRKGKLIKRISQEEEK